MNTVIWREKLKVAFNAHNLVVLGIGCLLLAVFTLGLVLPSFKEAGRLAAEIPAERQRLEQTREIHLVAEDLQGKLIRLRDEVLQSPRQFGPEYGDSPVAVRLLAGEHGVVVRDMSLEITGSSAPDDHLRLRVKLAGELEPMRRLALDLVWLPSLAELAEIGVERDQDGFLLTALLLVSDQ